MKFKKLMAGVLCAAMTVGMLTGCGSKSSSSSDSSSGSSKAKVTLTFGSHQSGLPSSGIVQDLAKEYEKETGVHIDFQISPDDQWRDLIKAKMDSGEAPDIMCVDSPINLESSLPMDKYSVDLSDQEWVSRMNDGAKNAVSVDGKTYGITFAGEKMYFYIYNKDIFNKLGLSVPKTYKDFTDVCDKILKSGTTPIYECTTNGWHQVLPLFETGGTWLNDDPKIYDELNDNTKKMKDVPTLLTVLKEMKDCADKGYFGQDYLSNSWENSKKAIATGQCAMTIAELGWINEVDEAYPDFGATSKLGYFVMPWGDNQTIGVNNASNAYFINKKSKHIKEAEDFFAFLAKPENLEKRLKGDTMINALCWKDTDSKYTDDEQKFIDSYPKAQVVQTSVNYVDSQWMDIGKDLESMFTGASTPEDVVNTIDSRRADEAKLHNDSHWDS
ncbi:MAG: ABC transporter substrate-binding protein [Eubacteriales bacterium]|jgi:raffinose/stachyose/melibiose transport system substrate-binding protein|nr:ABC transporter substrate-binding protein [Lachnospiraceae bacterium]MCH4064967.1 ABC transporter substrate-binding protein [Lachnospiraceae bacterium]MCH4103943.1 ABC transporter substrate-binding protein [Lachnospiraceae bacterium]MDD5859836.1 ABC transporter substrate-binding protein [Eubacteriales bacterium]